MTAGSVAPAAPPEVAVPGVQVERLSLRHGDAAVLDEVTFTLTGPLVMGLVGPAGAGKSSLLSVLAGLRRATSGVVRVGGEPVFENPAATRQVCLVHRSGDTLGPSSRVRAALDFAATLRPGWDDDYACALADRFGIEVRKRLGELDDARRAALGAVLGLAARTPVTLFDGTDAGMDAATRRAFRDELRADHLAHPRMIILAGDPGGEAAALCDETLVLVGGRLLAHDKTEALLARGAAVSGAAEAVDQFARDLVATGAQIVGERWFGRTKCLVVHGDIDPPHRAEAAATGLDLGPMPLPDLVDHLARPGGAG